MRLKLKPMVIAIHHALHEVAAQYQYEQSLKPLERDQIVIDESSSFTQAQIDFLAAKV